MEKSIKTLKQNKYTIEDLFIQKKQFSHINRTNIIFNSKKKNNQNKISKFAIEYFIMVLSYKHNNNS